MPDALQTRTTAAIVVNSTSGAHIGSSPGAAARPRLIAIAAFTESTSRYSAPWIAEMSSYLKSLDANHLVTPGAWGYRSSSERREWLADHAIDHRIDQLLLDLQPCVPLCHTKRRRAKKPIGQGQHIGLMHNGEQGVRFAFKGGAAHGNLTGSLCDAC